MSTKATMNIWQSDTMIRALKDSFLKLDPRTLWRNPVMLMVEAISILTTVIAISDLSTGGDFKLHIQITIWLWFTVLFSTFSEALAEGRGRARPRAFAMPGARPLPVRS